MLRVRTIFTVPSGGPYLSTMYFTATTEDQLAADTASGRVRSAWAQLTGLWLTSVTAQVDPPVAVINPATGDQTGEFTTSNAPVTGATSGTDNLPPQTQGLVNWRTNAFVGGRRLRGRTFIPSVTEAFNSASGVPAGAMVTTHVPNFVSQLISSVIVTYSIWSREHGLTAPVASGLLSGKWAVLRSRRD